MDTQICQQLACDVIRLLKKSYIVAAQVKYVVVLEFNIK